MTPENRPYSPILHIQKLIRNATICLGGFLIVALTAAPSFNAFTKYNASSMAQGIIAYVPLFIGISFLMALLACSLALIVLLICQQFKADCKIYQNNPEEKPFVQTRKNMKRLSYLSYSALILLGLSVLINLLTYVAILNR